MTQAIVRPNVVVALSRRTEFLAGGRDTIPLLIGSIPFGLILGALAAGSGLSFTGAVAMPAIVFAGSAQFVAVGLLSMGAGWPIIVLTTFVVNLRHVLYSTTLAPHVKRLPQRWQIPLAFWLTDETFVVMSNHYNRAGDSPHRRWYYLGSAVLMYELFLIGGMALVTFATRYSMFVVAGRVEFPARLVSALRYVPPAVLTAIIVPAVLIPKGDAVSLSYGNAYLVGALVAFGVGWFGKNLFLTILLGMLAFWGWQWIQAAWPA